MFLIKREDFLDLNGKSKTLRMGNFYKNVRKKLNILVVGNSKPTKKKIVNANILIKKKDINLFITEKKKSYLSLLAQKLKAEVVDHNNYIGGRYSVLSEVGMLPAELMGLNYKNFRQLNNLILNPVLN